MTISQYNVYPGLTPARVVSVSNITGTTYFNGQTNNGVGATLTTGASTLTIDSVVVNNNDRVLLMGQTLGYTNGIYIANVGGTFVVLTRSADFHSIEQMKEGQFISIAAGFVYAGAMFTLVEPFPAAIGVPLVSGANNIDFATITAAASSLYLAIANNLSDLNSVPAALLNLGLGPTVIKSATATITAAQFNGMYAAPVLLLASPGAGLMNIIESVQLNMTFVSADYAAGGVVGLQYGNTVHGAGPAASNTEAAADFFAAASTTFSFIGVNGNTVGALPWSTCANAGIYLSNLTQAFTTGDSTFAVNIKYHTVTA
jgi:hypothetical protein